MSNPKNPCKECHAAAPGLSCNPKNCDSRALYASDAVPRELFDRAMIIINESYLYGHEDGKNNTERGANWVLGRLNALRALAGKGEK